MTSLNLQIFILFCRILAENGWAKPLSRSIETVFNEIKLIPLQKKDSDSHFTVNRANRTIKSLFLGLLYIRLLGGLVFLGFPVIAEANITSFFSNIFYGEDTKQEMLLAETNSQNMALLQAVPNSDPNPSKGGGDITIVEDEALLSEVGPSGTIADIEEGYSDGMISTYIVRKGDSLSLIAEMFNVSVNTIEWANDIKNDSHIKEGDTLIILPISGVKYTVKPGDNLKNIVAKYKGDLEEVLQYNNLKSDSPLAVGDIIIIPNGRVESVANSAKGTNSKVKGTNSPSYVNYYLRPIEGGRKSQGLHGYNGVDLAAPLGTSIFAAASGKVIISKNYGWNGGYGNYVVIEHPNKTQTVYGHMSRNISYQGEYVVQGQIIGSVGSTGRSTGPHLHFEVRGARNPF